MNRAYRWIVLSMLLAVLMTSAMHGSIAEENGETAEWTVMFYFCGSDLESQHEYASGNLEEISICYPYAAMRNYYMGEKQETLDGNPGVVNVVAETGGSKEWHAQDLGMEIATDRLQRWHFEPKDTVDFKDKNGFVLVDECPLTSMAESKTLSDYILWSAENYPAKKYALVLWGHGMGSSKGVLVDELFNLDTLELHELHSALEDGGVTFETVLFDACMMGNLETAYAIKDYAHWMVASEELVVGKGTAVDEWLQRLYFFPEWDGKRLGKTICEKTLMKYENGDDEEAAQTTTWSVIDLSKIEEAAEQLDLVFEYAGKCYETDPAGIEKLVASFENAWEFGVDKDHMIDLGGSFDSIETAVILDKELYYGLTNALAEAVVYNERSTGRYSASGLSFCYAITLDTEGLDQYARNCPLAHYLALLDAINPEWTAPDWVYEKVEHLRDIREIPEYHLQANKIINEKGVPGIGFPKEDGFSSFSNVNVELYRLSPDTGNIIRMGYRRAEDVNDDADTGMLTYALMNFGTWPAVEGVHCDLELYWDYGVSREYMIPIQMGTDIKRIRCEYDLLDEGKMNISGLWEGFDIDTIVSSRNSLSLAKVAGQDFSLLYPIDGSEEKGNIRYETGKTMQMYRALDISEQTLPAGTYYLEYWVEDLFRRLYNAGRVEVSWDGEKASLPNPESWQGTIDLGV